MVATRSKRKQANEEFIKLPYSTTKKKNKIPVSKKKEKSKTKKSRKQKETAKKQKVQLDIVETVDETISNDDNMNINQVAKNYKISNKPLKHKKKNKAKGRKDHKKFYDLHFFEVHAKSNRCKIH